MNIEPLENRLLMSVGPQFVSLGANPDQFDFEDSWVAAGRWPYLSSPVGSSATVDFVQAVPKTVLSASHSFTGSPPYRLTGTISASTFGSSSEYSVTVSWQTGGTGIDGGRHFSGALQTFRYDGKLYITNPFVHPDFPDQKFAYNSNVTDSFTQYIWDPGDLDHSGVTRQIVSSGSGHTHFPDLIDLSTEVFKYAVTGSVTGSFSYSGSLTRTVRVDEYRIPDIDIVRIGIRDPSNLLQARRVISEGFEIAVTAYQQVNNGPVSHNMPIERSIVLSRDAIVDDNDIYIPLESVHEVFTNQSTQLGRLTPSEVFDIHEIASEDRIGLWYVGYVIDTRNIVHELRKDNNHPSEMSEWGQFYYVDPKVNQVTFEGDGQTVIYSDQWRPTVAQLPSTLRYALEFSSQQYWDPDSDGVIHAGSIEYSNPILYAGGSVPLVSASWNMPEEFTNFAQGLVNPLSIKVRGTSTYFNIDATDAIVDLSHPTREIRLDPTLVDRALPDGIYFQDDMPIDWELSFDGGTNWSSAGRSVNDLYVTRVKPQVSITTPRYYHTVVDLSVRAAAGAVTDNQIIDAVWARFATRDVKRIDGTPLTYWKADAKSSSVFEGFVSEWSGTLEGSLRGLVPALLNYVDGQCMTWAALFLDCLKVQSVEADMKFWQFGVDDRVRARDRVFAESFLVKNWERISSYNPSADWPYLIVDIPILLQYPMTSDLVRLNGIPGQNADTPNATFDNHVVVRLNGRLYDPSYGVIHDSETDLLKNAIEAVVTPNRASFIPVDEVALGRDINGDGRLEKRVRNRTPAVQIDEKAIGRDINGDGRIDVATAYSAALARNVNPSDELKTRRERQW